MKKLIFYFSILFVSGFQAGCQTKVDSASAAKVNSLGEISISDDALATAKWAKFDYIKTLDRAKTGDSLAVHELLEFHALVDHADAVGHSITCLELIPYVGDQKFAANLYNMPLNMRNLIRDRLMVAASKTKNESLKNLAKSCPITLKAMEGYDPYNRRGGAEDKNLLHEREMTKPDQPMGKFK